MSQFFDHVSCPSCGAAFDPEKITVSGKKASCPKCGSVLRLTDLFGLKSNWVGEGDEPENLSLEDAIPGSEKKQQASGRPDRGSSGDLPARKGDSQPLSALDAIRQLKNED